MRAIVGQDPSQEVFVRSLRAAGLRATAVRLATLAALRRHPHSETEGVIRTVRAELGTVSSQAVYNVLAVLVEGGLVRRVEPAGSVALYELRVGDNHHHIVCRGCGAVADVDCSVGRRPCLTPSESHGYLLDEAEVTYWGVCPRCQSATASGQSSPSVSDPESTHKKRMTEYVPPPAAPDRKGDDHV